MFSGGVFVNGLVDIQNDLFALKDCKYKQFHSKLIPTVPNDNIIGVRTPILRKYAKELSKKDISKQFINSLPHRFYDENNLHAFLIETINEYDETIYQINRFLPYIDNWATCDMMNPVCFKKNIDKLYKEAYKWINSEYTYAVRYGICVFMKYYLGKNAKEEYIETISCIDCDEYYIKMAIAWYFATALNKNYDLTLNCFQNCKLDVWIHNKAIQKACESYSISQENKSFLKKLKRHEN